MSNTDRMRKGMLWGIAKLVYRFILRRFIKQAIDDPNSDADDKTIAILDQLFSL